MANKCTPKPASFDCFLITNNSQWESKICMYEKECWSCLCCLPRSLLLEQICTFCSPGIDTSSGWTRTLSACPRQECLEELQRSWRASLWWWQWLSTLAGVGVKPWLEEGLNPSRCPPLPAQASSIWAPLPMAAGHINLLPLSNNSVRDHVSCGVHCLAKSQIPKQGTVLCDGAWESSRSGLLSPLWWPHFTSTGTQSPCSLPSIMSAGHQQCPSVSLSPGSAQKSDGFPWTANYKKALPEQQGLGARRFLQSRVYAKIWSSDYQ